MSTTADNTSLNARSRRADLRSMKNDTLTEMFRAYFGYSNLPVPRKVMARMIVQHEFPRQGRQPFATLTHGLN